MGTSTETGVNEHAKSCVCAGCCAARIALRPPPQWRPARRRMEAANRDYWAEKETRRQRKVEARSERGDGVLSDVFWTLLWCTIKLVAGVILLTVCVVILWMCLYTLFHA